MKITAASLFSAALVATLALATSADAVIFRQVAQLDGFGLGTGLPVSVAAFGDDVFIGTLGTSSTITRVTDPLGTPTNAGTLGPGGPASGSTNGFLSLNTDGVTLVAATNNGGGAPDVVQSFNVASGALNFATDSATLGAPIGPPNDRFDGAAVDPNTGNIFVTAFGAGFPAILDPVTGAPVAGSSPTSLFTGGTGTGFRDVDFDNATGDIYLRAVNGIAQGTRVGPDDFDRPVSGGAGVDAIVNDPDGFNSAINVEFLPAAFAGDDLVIYNVRNNPNTFADQVLVAEAGAIDQAVPATFLGLDGSPFTTADAGSGIYDFSYDPVNSLLYVADFSEGVVQVFTVVPEPTSAALLAVFAGLVGLRRRSA